MKRFISVLAATVLAFTAIMPFSTAVFASSAASNPFALTPQKEILAKIPDVKPTGSVMYGSTTDLNADFFDGWSNNATNADIKTLIFGGYDLVEFTVDQTYAVNPIAVKSWSAVDNADGSKTYTFEIYDNLVYNDGTKITAKDYLFNAMLTSSPEWKALKAVSAGADTLFGYDAFNAGETKTFTGLHLINSYKFSATIKAEEVPNFYEITNISLRPYPMHVIAPGVGIFEASGVNGGATLTQNFTAELLTKTILDPVNGFRYNPKVSAGPYQFDYYDSENRIASVVTNPKFLGNMDGTKPQIERISIKKVVSATMMDELATGQVDMLAGVSGGAEIVKGLDLADAGKAAYFDYPRAGYGKIQFQCDFGPTQFQAVRQAVAWSLDRDEFCRQFTKGYGIVVNGRFGASQWEYIDNKDELDERLINYTYNLAQAKQLLIDDGWTLNATGGEYVEGPNNIRHKMVDGKLMPLVIEWIGSENNEFTDLVAAMLPAEAIKIGMKINLTKVDFATLTMHLNRNGISEKVYHMYNLATGFTGTYEPWYYYSKTPRYFGGNYNNCYIIDDEMDKIVNDMKLTASTDLAGWSKKWMDFQVRWNEVLCEIPMYSNLYHDFFNPKIENYTPSPLWSFRYAIQRSSIK